MTSANRMTAFHPDYKMTDGYRRPTVDDLMKVVEIAKQAGLQYIYPATSPARSAITKTPTATTASPPSSVATVS